MLGLIGSGMIGTSVARLAVAAGLEVVLSNSRGPETLAGLAAELGGRARAATVAEAAEADLVVAAIPFNTITPHQLVCLARTAGAPDRSALPIAGDDAAARAEASRLLDVLGYDAVNVGSLAESWRSEPNTPLYIQPYLGQVPAMSVEEFLRWSFQVPGMAVAASQVAKLAAMAVRLRAGEARLPSEA